MRELRNKTERLIGRHGTKRKHIVLTCILGLVVVVATSTLMRLPAFTQRKPTFCGMEDAGSSCTVAGHVHDLSCYSDPAADVETEADWVLSLPQDEEGLQSQRLVTIARSQLGYGESELNYEVREDGSVAGYTRYGAWDGSPYEDWDAAFVAFCLEYANVDAVAMPREHNADAWMDALKTAGLYEDHAVSPYFPLVGDLVFFVRDDGHTMVGLVEQTDADVGEFGVVAGDWGDAVSQIPFTITDGKLLGYGRLPDEERPIVAEDPGQQEPDALGEPEAVEVEQVHAADDELQEVREAEQPTELEEPVEPKQPAEPETTQEALELQGTQSVPQESPTSGDAQLTTLKASVDGLNVRVNAQLPANKPYRLVATRVKATGKRVRQVEACQSKELVDGISVRAHVGDNLTMLDLSILDEHGNEVEPDGEATVRILQAQMPDAVVHFCPDGPQCLETQATKSGFSFQTEGFSVFAFAYTVDFYYEGYEYHLAGGDKTSLLDLLQSLQINEDVANVQDVVFSDPSLVSIERKKKDWILRSIRAFDTEETLTITMATGDVYVIRVLDAKTYYFAMNVNDATGGCVYERSSRYGPEVVEAVTDAGVAGSAVRPRSADEPFSSSLSATRGYHFVGWRINGYQDYGMGATGPDVSKQDLYSIRPSIDEWNVEERSQTFTACFAPDGQYLITFDKYIWADEYGRVNGSVQQGGAKTYSYIEEDGTTGNVYFCYSGSSQGAVAVPNDDGKFVGWYRVDTGALVCESASFVPPQDLSENIIVQARFVKAELLNVRYYSYNSQGGAYVGDVSIRGGSDVGKDLYEQVYEQRSPSGAVAYDVSNYSFVAWRDEAGKIVTRDHELTDLPAATRDVAYRAEYLATRTSRILVTVGTPGTGKVCQGVNDQTDQWIGWGNVVQSGSYITLKNALTASASDGYRFDHWEFNGVELDTHNDTLTFVDKPITSNHIQELKAVFVPICTITFNVGVIQQVGINAPDFQHWEDVPWCSKSVQVESPAILDIVGEDLYSQSVDTGSWFMLPNLATNTPDGTQTIRVSQTNNGYNLLTHTFRGWRQKDGDGTIYAAGTWMPAQDSVEYEAVWDAYLPGKSGYYGTEVGAYRYNTNTCGFFVRLFGSTFNIDDTGTYTDCLFTSRIFVGGQSLFATSDGVSGKRMDFFGNSNANERQQIDLIDSQLRSYANTSIPYSEEYSGQNNGTAYPGSLITFEQPFPSDEFIFSRIRVWNASIGQDRKIRINGTLIPQDKLTADYFDLRWYVLKDQENSWHVDGMLIPKYAKLVVTKRFDGSEAAIQSIKNSGNFYIGVTRDKSKTENTSLSEEYRLRLHWHSDQDTNYDMGYYLSDNGTYTWVIDTLEPLSTYWVAEHYYTAQSPYATARSIHVSNTTQGEVDVGDSNRIEIQAVYSYPDEATIADIQTVAFSNRYTQPREIVLVKQDASTSGPIEGARFTFTLYVDSDGQTVALPLSVETDDTGMIVINVPNEIWYENKKYLMPDGSYRFQIEEEPREGYQELPGSITGTVELSSVQVSHITLDTSVTDNPSLAGLVGLGQINDTSLRPLMYIQNVPRTQTVAVAKQWTNGATTPVTMQLMRNGVAVPGKSVQLSSANSWTAVWEDLPAYVNGSEATYTVREEWIGEPGGEGAVHYNASADADGYEDYIVTQTQSVDDDGTIHVHVQNTLSSGQVVFSKVDDAQRAVAGAEFTVYTDANCSIPITAAAFTADPHKQRPAVFVSDAEGMVTIEGLSPGTYYVRETYVPTGYVLADGRICKLEVGSKSSSITYVDWSGNEMGLTQVENPQYTREVSIRKVIAGTNNPLQGAVFSLHGELTDGSMDPAPMVGRERLTSGTDGKVSLGKLRQGVYYLVEESAPSGYNKLECSVRITVPNSDSVAITAIKTASNTAFRVDGNTIMVSNSEGVVLPSTGADFPWAPYVVGAMVLGACLLFARRGGERACTPGQTG
ncbi:MAG: SpaA isopeptide-forming pilin-related protein [Coriobacteriales bacterium]|nr:SpaA isopeptide-forming pilin-related protein [Coriobacteriales bacterium]